MAEPSNNAVAEFRKVEKLYNMGTAAPIVRALRGVDLMIPRGQYVAIMGPSGSGKSTLMNILGCLDRPTHGDYFIDGVNVAGLTDEDLSRVRGERLGFVFQNFNLITQLTIEDNVQVPLFYSGVAPALRRQRSEQALERVGLADRVGHRPTELSGGQQQRVAIARALVNEPSLLLADEPTGNLDSSTGQAILDMFDHLHRQGLTIVMVTHDEAVAERCQRIVRVLDGLIDSDQLVNLNQPQPA
ncbi:MAG: ABC transporter ATP-binding protein [Phycisphaeraceae bacterium]